jgi:hypothetical protein
VIVARTDREIEGVTPKALPAPEAKADPSET